MQLLTEGSNLRRRRNGFVFSSEISKTVISLMFLPISYDIHDKTYNVFSPKKSLESIHLICIYSFIVHVH